jgi:hypothetical protein
MRLNGKSRLRSHQTKETFGVVMVVFGLIWLTTTIVFIALEDITIRIPNSLFKMILAFMWFILPFAMIGFGLSIILRHHRAIRAITARETHIIRSKSFGRLFRKKTIIMVGIGLGLILIFFILYWSARPTTEQIKAKPEIFVVTEPIRLTGSFLGVAFGKHRIQGEFLDKKWSTPINRVFFLSDANGMPFNSDLPAEILVDKVTARLGDSIAYGVSKSIHTQYAWERNLGGSIVVFIDNASDSDFVVTVGSQTLPILPAFSYAKITIKKGIHTFGSHVTDSSEPIDNNRVFLSEFDRTSWKEIKWYIYNIGGRNTYHLKSAQYIPTSNH